MNKIDIKNLSFSYTKYEQILKDISLIIDKRSTAIVGQNGAGKTTFVKLLKGLLKPTQGYKRNDSGTNSKTCWDGISKS